MTIVHQKTDSIPVSIFLLKDPKLSFGEKGLLCWLLTFPENTDVLSLDFLIPGEYVENLKKNGYLQFGENYEWIIVENPVKNLVVKMEVQK